MEFAVARKVVICKMCKKNRHDGGFFYLCFLYTLYTELQLYFFCTTTVSCATATSRPACVTCEPITVLLLPITTVLLSPVVTMLLLCCSVATGTTGVSCLITTTTVSFFGCAGTGVVVRGVVVRGVVVRGVVVRGGVVRGLLSHGHLLVRAVSQLSRR